MKTLKQTEKTLKKYSEIRKERAEESLEIFGQIYLPHHVQGFKPSNAHKEIYNLLLEITKKRGQKMAVAAPRGFGKSTLISLIYIIYNICYAKEEYIVIISETADSAMKILDNVKKELMENEKIKTDFPEVFESGSRPKAPRWAQREIITRNKIKVAAISVQQQIRGIKFKSTRPTLVLLDDIESARSISSSENREKLREWLSKSVLNVGTEQTNYLFLGNLYHVNCLLGEYLAPDKNAGWIKKIYRAIINEAGNPRLWEQWARIYNCQEEFANKKGPFPAKCFFITNKEAMLAGTKVLWPERWDYYTLMERQEEDPIAFRSEYQNNPIDPRSLVFNPENFHYWDKTYPDVEALLKGLGDHVTFYGACDPSLGNDSAKGDYSAIIILAWERITKALYVVVADIQRRQPDQLVNDIIGHFCRFRWSRFGYEANSSQSLLIKQIESAAREKRLFIPIEEIKNTTQKKTRIHELQPLTKNGTIQFYREHKILIEQMRDFPQGKHDDGPDALEMAVRISGRVTGGINVLEALGKW